MVLFTFVEMAMDFINSVYVSFSLVRIRFPFFPEFGCLECCKRFKDRSRMNVKMPFWQLSDTVCKHDRAGCYEAFAGFERKPFIFPIFQGGTAMSNYVVNVIVAFGTHNDSIVDDCFSTEPHYFIHKHGKVRSIVWKKSNRVSFFFDGVNKSR